MDNPILIFAIIITIILVAIVIFIMKEYKWTCSNGTCKKIFGGEYSTREECINKCNKPEKDIEMAQVPQPPPPPEKKYACTNQGICVESPEGIYVDEGSCSANCTANVYNYSVIPYYPQSLYGPFWPRRRYWGRRGWRRFPRGYKKN